MVLPLAISSALSAAVMFCMAFLQMQAKRAKSMAAWLEFKKNHPFDENKETGISGKAIPYIYSMGGLFLMEEKKTWAVGAGSGISWLKALLVSYLISVLLLLLLSFLLWKFSWKESWVQAGIVVIYLASSFSGGRMAGNMAGKRRFLWGICFGIVYFCHSDHRLRSLPAGRICRSGRLLWAAAVCAVGGMAGGMTAHGR